MRRRLTRATAVRLVAGLAACLLALTGCRAQQLLTEDQPAPNGGTLSIAAGNSTGVYYIIGGAIARLIGQHLTGYRATVEVTDASVENVRRVVDGESQLGFTTADIATDAVRGEGSFGSPQPIRALARTYNNVIHVVVRTDAKISSLKDLKRKRVSTGAPGSGTEVIVLRLLTLAGLNPDHDVQRKKLDLQMTTDRMKDGGIDAMIWSGGLPTVGIKDLFHQAKGTVKFLALDSYLGRMQNQYTPLYGAGTIPKGVYGTDKDVPTIAVPNLLMVRDTMGDDLAYKLTKLIFDYKADLVRAHDEARNINLRLAQDTGEVALHDGAKRYYREHPSG
ncbi:MAG TPA: TAXI family TRAP transporter solute-binding subunit [Mycobacteriales bacterium]|nr:TAXI family TRAP transporter solute-binding subunit [Mycobacteriales bacterium]